MDVYVEMICRTEDMNNNYADLQFYFACYFIWV
jgi:hypothetical protein